MVEPPEFPELREHLLPSDRLALIRARRGMAREAIEYLDQEEAALLAAFPELRVQP